MTDTVPGMSQESDARMGKSGAQQIDCAVFGVAVNDDDPPPPDRSKIEAI